MKTELILIRHGETNYNSERRYFGHSDPSLNEKGRDESEKLSKMCEDFEIIYTSDLKRARETAKIININKRKIVEDRRLRELNFGIFEGKRYGELVKEYPKDAEEFFNNYSYAPKDGESVSDMQRRAVEVVEEIIIENRGKRVAIVTHAGVIRAMLSYYLNKSLELYWTFKIDKSSMTKLSFEDGFVCVEYSNIGV